jgi:hypothetical protein
MTKTDLYGSCMASEIFRFAHQIVRARVSAGTTSPDLVFVITFRKIVPRTYKVARKTPPAILYNSALKKQVLKIKTDKVTVIRVTK